MIEIQLIKGDGQARVQGQIPQNIFEEIYQNFLSTQSRSSQAFTKTYGVGGRVINLTFANQDLAPFISPALAHLDHTNSPNPDLQICIWDKAMGGDLPDSIWKHESFEDTIQDARLLYLLDHSRNIGLFWVSKPNLIPYYEIGAPLRTIFHWWFQRQNFQILHSGAVGYKDACIIIVGKGGSGKSSTALACIQSDLNYLGDDYCLVKIDGSPKVFSLYNTLKLNWDNVSAFPDLPEPLINTSGVQLEKAIFFIHEVKPASIVHSLPIKAIMIPKIIGKNSTQINPTSPAQTLTALAPSTVLQLAGSSKESFHNLRQLIQMIPTYTLALGNNFKEIPEKIKDFIING